jgi:hypothetical protein
MLSPLVAGANGMAWHVAASWQQSQYRQQLLIAITKYVALALNSQAIAAPITALNNARRAARA